jgi:hypothetical protein
MEEIQLSTGQWILVEIQGGVYQTREEARTASKRILAERQRRTFYRKESLCLAEEHVQGVSPDELLEFIYSYFGARKAHDSEGRSLSITTPMERHHGVS